MKMVVHENADRKAKVKINAEIDRPATVETSALLHIKQMMPQVRNR